MRKFFALIAVVLFLGAAATAFAHTVPLPANLAPTKAQFDNELPARVPTGFARVDTLNFGYYQVIGGNSYAVLGQEWTFDHGTPSLEGWYSVDETANLGDYWRQINTTNWDGHGNTVAAPIITGTGSAWVGIFEDAARTLCWESGLGYGNKWCQRLTSPTFTYGGTGSVDLSFNYFEDSEFKFDYGKVLLSAAGSETQLNGPGGFTGPLGTPPAGPWASYTTNITQSTMGGAGSRPFTIVFEFTSDGGWSDEDGSYATSYGPMGVDDVLLSGDLTGSPVSYNYDSDLQGWTASRCAGTGTFLAVHPLSYYTGTTFPCACALSGYVLGMHDTARQHVTGQLEAAYAPPADRTSYQSYNQIFADWDQYSWLPQNGGVFYRPGWNYYPYLCPITGNSQWSGRKGQDVWHYTGDSSDCTRLRNVGTDWGVSSDCQLVGFMYEVYASCDAFGIPSTQCTGQSSTNESPLIDNIQVRMTGVINAPVVAFDTGDAFIDGFPQTDVLGVMNTGNANVARDLESWPNTSPENPWKLGDSLVVLGPTPTTSTKWDAKMWWHVAREGPGQTHIAAYNTWKTKVADGRSIVGANAPFTFGWMDSVETNTVSKVRYDSYFRENDDDYTANTVAPKDIWNGNAMIPDGILTPGTKIEYFITANYTCLPTTYYYYPDTIGKYYYEFEMLPGYRTDMNDAQHPGWYKMPCVLWVNSSNTGRRGFIERSLNMALTGISASSSWQIPDPAPWDRYDYQNASSNFHAPLIRNTGGMNGATIAQLLGYKMIIWSTGTYDASGCDDYRDWQGLSDWLATPLCNGNLNRQGLWITGDNAPGCISAELPSFLNNYLGADYACNNYYDADCPTGKAADVNYCVNLVPQAGAWTPSIDIDVYGNWCPQQYSLDVISTLNSGVANKSYGKVIAGSQAHDAQITNDQLSPTFSNNYRSVIDGYYISHAIQRTPPPDPSTECVYDSSLVVNATSDEVKNILKWCLGITNTQALGLCQDPCLDITNVPGGNPGSSLVNELSQNRPNPFNPSTQISFSLAQTGPATLAIFDVNGRRVRTLVDGPLTAGPHVTVWDGLDNAGHKVPAGIYWSQLSTTGYNSNKKMVVVR